ncbi:MAG TPA: hypothetical protein VKZ63_16060 [Kofleriaceae bacterium]|nr:hypothetical protein [Kofleriaceae bacterium]
MTSPTLLRLFLAVLPATAGCFPQSSGPVPVPLEPALEIDAAGDVTCARLRNDNTGCWGWSDHGALGRIAAGTGPQWLPLDEDALTLAVSPFHGCAVVDGGAVHCWGANPDDLLGRPGGSCPERAVDGTCIARPGPTLLDGGAIAVTAGGRPQVPASSSSAALPPRPLTCALMDSGQVMCWGDNGGGVLGTLDPVTDRPEPDLVFDTGGFPLRDVVQVAAGEDRVYAIDAYGDVWRWGGAGQPGARREPLPAASHIAVGARHACMVTAGGAVMCWGDNASGQAGDPDAAWECDPQAGDCLVGPTRVVGVERAVEVAVGDHHSCAVLADGAVTCWGSNQNLQLGVEVATLVSAPVRAALPGKAVGVAAGASHSCAVLLDGAVYCWGLDSRGQLGGVTP